MRDKKEFYSILQEMNGREPAELARLSGDFDFTRYVLQCQRPPEEGGADLGLMFTVHVPHMIAGFPPSLYKTPIRRTALEDFLVRRLAEAAQSLHPFPDVTGGVQVAAPGQKLLPRSGIIFTQDYVEAKLDVRMPVRDGLFCAADAVRIFFDDLPQLVNDALIYSNLAEAELNAFVALMEDADAVRQEMSKRGLAAFAAQGSALVRENGREGPAARRAPPLTVATDLLTEIPVPNEGSMRGLAVAGGFTLIMGDDYSGRQELIAALAAGVYNHIPGDGRERMITVPDAVQIVAEAGRPIQRVNLSAFLRDAPDADPAEFTRRNATAAESQLASLVEALQVGAGVILADESTSCPAFLTADTRALPLQKADKRRLLPLAAYARKLMDDQGVSFIIGVSPATAAEFVPLADQVLLIEDYRVTNVTTAARALKLPAGPVTVFEKPATSPSQKARWVVPTSIDPSRGRQDEDIVALDNHRLRFGRSVIDLSGVSQIAERHQVTTIGLILYYAKLRYLDEPHTVAELLDLIDQDLGNEGLECLTRAVRGDLVRPRRFEIAAALNRLDTLRIAREPPRAARA